MPVNVLVLDGPPAPFDLEERILAEAGARLVHLTANTPPDERDRLLAEADAILCDSYRVTAEIMERAPRLRIVSEYGIGYDNIDVEAASARGIWVTNVPGFCAPEVADHTMALLLAASRRLLALDRSVRVGEWRPEAVAAGAPRLSDQCLGLIGFGAIARGVARRATGFGLRVLVYSPHTSIELARSFGAERVELAELLAASDYVSLHLPASSETRGLVDAALLARCKPTAWLINTARGSIVDEPALFDALRTGRLAGAALDVRQTEPAPANDPFRDLPNVILTPHAAYFSERSIVELRERAARN
ncbi:MAG TPA: C-terminal binding protein, partial [Chloroflexota bacterium]|nr:C-terminal binding protein [Chloroflexota bacterium]